MPELRVVVTAVALLIAMIICAWLGRRQRSAIVLLVLLSVVWLSVDRYFEGAVLLTVSSRHGLVASDLVGLAGLCVAGALFLRRR